MTWFWIGMGCGILLTVPLVFFAARRTARRVRTLERRARTAERLAQLGTLTGGLAHEIKNPLSTIGLNLQLLREYLNEAKLPDDIRSRFTHRLDALTSESDRLRGILEDFLAFAGRLRLDPQQQDINAIVEQIVDFYLPQAEASGVTLRTQLDPDAGSARFDSALLKQSLLNLLLNATQAMVDARYSGKPHGGAIDLIIRTEPIDEPREEPAVAIHVIDTGPGIDDAKRAKLFQPYFSTKKGGTGLGLPTAQRIVNEHGGTIRVHSDPGQGTDFTLVIPRAGPDLPDTP